jgi:hypothetical protein
VTALTITTDHPDAKSLVATILAAQQADATVAPRSRRALTRAAGSGRLVAAYDHAGTPVGWVLSEPCTPRTTELGAMYVLPGHRDGKAFRELTTYALAMRPKSIVVTMDGRFAQWLLDEWHLTETTLWGVTRASAGVFLVRRLAPWRLRAALGHVKQATPRYLILERP